MKNFEEKIAGSFFRGEGDELSKESVITITIDSEEPGEVTFANGDSDIMICVNKEDLERIVAKMNK